MENDEGEEKHHDGLAQHDHELGDDLREEDLGAVDAVHQGAFQDSLVPLQQHRTRRQGHGHEKYDPEKITEGI